MFHVKRMQLRDGGEGILESIGTGLTSFKALACTEESVHLAHPVADTAHWQGYDTSKKFTVAPTTNLLWSRQGYGHIRYFTSYLTANFALYLALKNA